MTFAIKAVLGMRGFYTFLNAQGNTVTRPAQVVEVHSPELVNIVVFVNTYDNAQSAPIVDYRSRRVTEFVEVDAFSYKAEAAPVVTTATVGAAPNSALVSTTQAPAGSTEATS